MAKKKKNEAVEKSEAIKSGAARMNELCEKNLVELTKLYNSLCDPKDKIKKFKGTKVEAALKIFKLEGGDKKYPTKKLDKIVDKAPDTKKMEKDAKAKAKKEKAAADKEAKAAAKGKKKDAADAAPKGDKPKGEKKKLDKVELAKRAVSIKDDTKVSVRVICVKGLLAGKSDEKIIEEFTKKCAGQKSAENPKRRLSFYKSKMRTAGLLK